MKQKKKTESAEEYKTALHFVNCISEDIRRSCTPPPSLDVASRALKKQVPKIAKAEYVEIEHTGEFVAEVTCPECGAVMQGYDDGKPLINFCFECGQALKYNLE